MILILQLIQNSITIIQIIGSCHCDGCQQCIVDKCYDKELNGTRCKLDDTDICELCFSQYSPEIRKQLENNIGFVKTEKIKYKKNKISQKS